MSPINAVAVAFRDEHLVHWADAREYCGASFKPVNLGRADKGEWTICTNRYRPCTIRTASDIPSAAGRIVPNLR
jgi:hypothetical protein